MVPITHADEELFGTVVIAARLGGARAIVERLSARYEQEWADPRAGLPYALSMLALLRSGRQDLRDQLHYTEIVETLGDLLYHEPDHWLGRFLRIHTRLLLPADAGEHRHYIAAERARAAQDADELIARQARAAWQPWFACPYLLAARLAWESGDRDRDRVAALVSAAAAGAADATRPGEPVRFRALGGVMCEAFLWYHNQPGMPEHDTVGAMMDTLFPDQPAVWRVRADRSP